MGLAVLQKKAAQGYRDVDGFIKSRMVRQEKVSITILVGRSAIVDSDIKHALAEAVGFYNVRFERVSLGNEGEIPDILDRLNDTGMNDLLVIARGGGDNLAIFNSPEIAEKCLTLEPLFLSAIGHKEDIMLVQKVADKAFITPTELGQWLRAIYNDTMAELENSKARLIETVTIQLKTAYEKQLTDLEATVKSQRELGEKRQELHEREVTGFRDLVKNLQLEREKKENLFAQVGRLEERARSTRRTNLIIKLILAALGLIIGLILLKKA